MRKISVRKISVFIIVILSALVAASGQARSIKELAESEYTLKLIYENDFRDVGDIDDWVMEGPGRIYWWENKMTLIPAAQQAIYKKWEKNNRENLNPETEYYPVVEKCLNRVNPSVVDNLKDKEGNFSGGHIVCWNKAFETSNGYCVEYEFKPLSPVGLGIIFFSADGMGGQDVLSGQLKSRYGVFTSYTESDINCYHISYWANNAAVGKRGTCNLRKNSGFYYLADGNDPTAEDLDYSCPTFDFNTYRIRLLKENNRIRFFIDDELVIDYTDNRYNDIPGDGKDTKVDTGKVLGGGRIGIRQMVGLIGQYDNFRVYNLVDTGK